MRRLPIALLLFGAFLICGTVAYVAGPRASNEAPPVHVEMDAPERAVLREPVRLEVRVQNQGTTPIGDFGVKINRGYANAFTVIDTVPRAEMDDASTEKRLYFGPLGPGEGKVYRITLSPQRAGEFSLTVRFVAARRGFDPLPLVDRPSGKSELSATTTVVDTRPPGTPRATP